jgi:hypothetical protein
VTEDPTLEPIPPRVLLPNEAVEKSRIKGLHHVSTVDHELEILASERRGEIPRPGEVEEPLTRVYQWTLALAREGRIDSEGLFLAQLAVESPRLESNATTPLPRYPGGSVTAAGVEHHHVPSPVAKIGKRGQETRKALRLVAYDRDHGETRLAAQRATTRRHQGRRELASIRTMTRAA